MTPFDFYITRSPQFPLKIANYLNASDSIVEISAKLQQIFSNMQVQEALYLASPDLYQEIIPWMESNGVISTKALISLYKYVLRMSTRCTPFGLFSGVFLGTITENKPSLFRLEKKSYHVQFDMYYLSQLTNLIIKDEHILSQVCFRPNASIYKCQGYYRYYESQGSGGKRTPYLISMRYTPVLELILSKSANGCRFCDLVSSIVQLNITESEARLFLGKLIMRQVLVSELESNLTGEEYFDSIKRRLKTFRALSFSEDFTRLENLKDLNSSFIERTQGVRTINDKLKLSYDGNNFFCVDQIYYGQNQLDSKIANLISQELQQINPLYNEGISGELKNFKESFLKVYDREFVPLMTALDRDYGIGYGTVDGIFDDEMLKAIVKEKPSKSAESLSTLNKFILEKFILTKNKQQVEMVIDDKDLNTLTKNLGNLKVNQPATFYALGNLLSHSSNQVDEGNFHFNLTAISGPSALNLMSRFAFGEDALTKKLNECADYEQFFYDEAIVAEIIHIPEAGVANILKRPLVRKYEINILNCNSSEDAQQIPLDDLLIGIKNDRVVLWSKQYDKEIIPRMSTAHNYNSDTSVYRLLCSLQHQNLRFSFKWNWGVLMDEPHLPRVVYKHLILSRERWILSPTVLESLSDINTNIERDIFRNQYKLPQKVLLCEGDNELLIDFYCPLSIDILRSKLKKDKVILYEFLFNNNASPLKDVAGNQYSNELIIPLKSDKTNYDVESKVNLSKTEWNVSRKFSPGSEWLSLKIYCNNNQADKILCNIIAPLVTRAMTESLIEKWFFIRYYDPDHHLRVRFRINFTTEGSYGKLSALLCTAFDELINVGIIKNVLYDIYSRELERYGSKNIEKVESLFFRDSEMLLNALSFTGYRNVNKWLLACYNINQLFDEAKFSVQERLDWTSRMSNVFFKEFSYEEKLKYRLDLLYRSNKNELYCFFEKSPKSKEYCFMEEAGNKRKDALKYLLKNIEVSSIQDGRVKNDYLFEQIANYSHMFINRTFSIDQRRYELMVYHFLSKYFKAKLLDKRTYTVVGIPERISL